MGGGGCTRIIVWLSKAVASIYLGMDAGYASSGKDGGRFEEHLGRGKRFLSEVIERGKSVGLKKLVLLSVLMRISRVQREMPMVFIVSVVYFTLPPPKS